MPYQDFRQFLDVLRQQGELIDVAMFNGQSSCFPDDFLIWNVITNDFPNWEITLTLIS